MPLPHLTEGFQHVQAQGPWQVPDYHRGVPAAAHLVRVQLGGLAEAEVDVEGASGWPRMLTGKTSITSRGRNPTGKEG